MCSLAVSAKHCAAGFSRKLTLALSFIEFCHTEMSILIGSICLCEQICHL